MFYPAPELLIVINWQALRFGLMQFLPQTNQLVVGAVFAKFLPLILKLILLPFLLGFLLAFPLFALAFRFLQLLLFFDPGDQLLVLGLVDALVEVIPEISVEVIQFGKRILLRPFLAGGLDGVIEVWLLATGLLLLAGEPFLFL